MRWQPAEPSSVPIISDAKIRSTREKQQNNWYLSHLFSPYLLLRHVFASMDRCCILFLVQWKKM